MGALPVDGPGWDQAGTTDEEVAPGSRSTLEAAANFRCPQTLLRAKAHRTHIHHPPRMPKAAGSAWWM